MAIINPITTANTFLDWLTSTQGLIEHANYYSNTTNLVFTTANNTVNVYSNTVSVYNNTVNVYSNTVSVYNNTATLFNSTSNVYSNTVTLLAPLNTKINAAFDHANGAFTKANSALPSAGGSITGDLTISGNLVVSGQKVYANTQVVLIKDNIITLNAAIGEYDFPSLNAGIEVDRGIAPNVSIIWDEGWDLWQFTNDGTNYSTIASAETLTSSFNTTFGRANAAFDQANAAFNQANSAFSRANSAFDQANGAFNTANTANVSVNNLISFPNTANLLFYVSTAPATNKGAVGDVRGRVYLANDTFYYCTANYDGTTNIWSKIVATDIW